MPVPSLLHQIWMQGKDLVPTKYAAARATWSAVHPRWEIRVWDEADLVALVHGTPWEAALRLCRRLIQRADVLRCAVLERFGGVYADMDMYALKPLDPLLQNDSHVQVGETTFQGVPLVRHIMRLNNGIILCPPGLAFWRKEFLPSLMLRLHTHTLLDDISPAWNTIRTTGPGLWSSFVASNAIKAHPTHFFYALGIGKQQTSSELTADQKKQMEGCFVYHMQDSAWLDSWELFLVKSLIHKNWIITVSVLGALLLLTILVRLRIFRVRKS
jgi:mannosyltransferase OCH1-like enzyme